MRSTQHNKYVWIAVWLGLAGVAMPLSAADSSRPANRSFIRNISDLIQGHQRSRVKDTFRPVVREARSSTVRVLCDDKNSAFGTVVDARGYVLTKKSELNGGHIECILSDDRRVAAKEVAWDDDYDIALLKISASRLVAIQWSKELPQPGAWLATVGHSSAPAAIGFSSAEPRQIPAPRAILGVRLENTEDGPRITRVFSHSAAEKCNLAEFDVIQKVNGEVMQTSHQLSQKISRLRAGTRIKLVVLRSGRVLSTTARLGDRSSLGNEQVEIMEDLAGPLSARRTGFPLALQHDTVLMPEQCGGPIVDLSGKAVGINIARASRVASYAIPAAAILDLLPQLMVR